MRKQNILIKGIAALVLMAGIAGCRQLEERIDVVSSRVDDIENAQLNSQKQQMAAMGESVTKLEKTDAELKGYIETLQGTADALRKSISDNDEKISELEKNLDQAIKDAQNSDSALKSELEQQITAAKTDVLEQLAAAKTAMESRLEQIESTISTLQQKDAELEKKIADFKTSIETQVSSEISSAKEWTSATFATLEQYNAIVSEISGIRGNIETLEKSIAAVETKLSETVQAEVAKAMEPIKEQLSSEIAADIAKDYTEAISAVRKDVEDIASRVKTLEDELKLIKDDVDNIKKEIDDINGKIDSAKDGEIQSIVFVPEYSDSKARAYYNTEEDGSFTRGKMTLRFAIAPADMAAKIAGSWKSSLSLEATYTRTKAAEAGDDVSIPILDASASDGKLTVTASAETLDEAFFKKELSASVRLVVSLDGVGKSSEYVPMVPSVNMGQGEKLEIPDIYFKAYLVDNFDVNGDGEISADEALAVKQIDIASSSLPIRSLSGIEYFSNIESLDCSGNNLAALDLKSNAALRTLNCSNNRIVELDLSDKLYLMDVDCSGNRINRLVLSNARGLRNLNCANNAIEELDLKDSHFISKTECYGNPVKKLNIDDCEELRSLMLQGETANAIKGSELNFDKYNQASSFEFSARNLPFTSFKFTNSSSITSLALDGSFTEVNASGNKSMASVDISKLPSLERLDMSGCALADFDLSDYTELLELNLSNNALTELAGVEKCVNLVTLNCAGNSISSIDLHTLTELVTFNCAGNSISSIDLHTLTELVTFNCAGNPVRKLNIDNCEKLSSLILQNNVNAIKDNELSFDKYDQASSFEFSSRNLPFTSFKFTNSPSITSLAFDGEFTDVNISGNMGITSVDLSLLTELVNFDASLCGLQSLDVTKNLNLKSLDCHGNMKITLIDLSNNSALEDLNAAGLSISELDLTGITQLKTLDVSNDANLTRVICPSQEWLDGVFAVNDQLIGKLYEDISGNFIFGGSVKIGEKYWSNYNVGSTEDNLYGKTYTFDDAQKACPEGWRIPTRDELDSLSDHYSSETTVNGMKGRWFSGSKTYSTSVPAVFLPYQKGSSYGYYWSSAVDYGGGAYYLYFGSSSVHMGSGSRSNAYSVRCLKN